jgi:CRP-like cAMP-binding protein
VQLLGKVVRARRGLLRRGRDGWADGFLRRQRHGEGEWVLQEAGWLSRLPADFRMAWLARAKPFTVLRDEIIYREGDEGRCLYGVVSGAMAITIGPPLLTPRLINIMRPGTWFGVGPLLREGGRKMEFRAAEPSRLLRVSGADIDRIAAQFADTQRHIGALAMYGHDLASRVASELLIPSSSRRIAAVIIRIATPDPVDGRVGPAGVFVTQSQLAEMANVSRNLANSALRNFREVGWVENRYNRLRVTDRGALAAFAYAED